MRLHQRKVALLVQDDSLFCIPLAKKIHARNLSHFLPGLVQPSNDLFTSDGASLATGHSGQEPRGQGCSTSSPNL